MQGQLHDRYPLSLSLDATVIQANDYTQLEHRSHDHPNLVMSYPTYSQPTTFQPQLAGPLYNELHQNYLPPEIEHPGVSINHDIWQSATDAGKSSSDVFMLYTDLRYISTWEAGDIRRQYSVLLPLAIYTSIACIHTINVFVMSKVVFREQTIFYLYSTITPLHRDAQSPILWKRP